MPFFPRDANRNNLLADIVPRVSFENIFDSKQPKLEPKLVSALSETKLLFRLFRFFTETASFGVSIEPKQAEDQPKQTETNRNEVKWDQNCNKNYEIS